MSTPNPKHEGIAISIALILALVIIGIAGLIVVNSKPLSASVSPSVPTWEQVAQILPPCPQEDSGDVLDCFWDSKLRGNGEGTSFYAIDGVFTYQDVNR